MALGMALAVDPRRTPSETGFVWDAAAVEHLYNRAAFGARRDEIEVGLALGPEGLVERLLAPRRAWEDLQPELLRWEDHGFDLLQQPDRTSAFHKLAPAERLARLNAGRAKDRDQFFQLQGQWFESMIDHADPVRDKMALFWHGFFTTSYGRVGRKFELIGQFQWLRRNALGSYADLLHGIVRDPAMLIYLDNVQNYASEPNENFARELMELYSLGEGHYSEQDVREAARALTGFFPTLDGTFEFDRDQHDAGRKTILGVSANHDADSLVDVLLDQVACPRWVMRRILRWFEGVEPSEARLARYAALLRSHDYRLTPVLKGLFLDPEFYRPNIRGVRVVGPLEFLAVVCHKLGVHPTHPFYHFASVYLGQQFYAPPNVQGWPDGIDWMTNDALMRRGNVVGVIAGAFGTWDQLEEDVSARDAALMDDAMAKEERPARLIVQLRRLLGPEHWREDAPGLSVPADGQLVQQLLEDWLAIHPPRELHELLLRHFERERVESEDVAGVLARAVQLVFSLPEAQLG